MASTLFVHDPNRGFLYYILYLIVIILLYLITTGCIGHLTRLNYGWWVNELMLILASMGNILILFFTRKFFNTKSRMKILNIAILILVGALLAAMLFILFDYHNGVLLSYALGLAGILINLIVGYRAVQLKLPQAWLYLMAWSFLFTGLILESLAVSTLINSRWLAHYALQSGTIMEVLCFSLAIGFRVRNLIIEHESSIRQLNIVSRDLDLARRIQKRILPDGPPLAYTGNIQVYYEPLHAVGGDFYSFAEVAESQLGILVADVSGHGVAAALDSSTVKIAFDRARLQHAKKPSEILSEMNRFLIRYIEYRFVSAVYIRIDYKKKTIEYCTAGHPPILLYHHKNSQIEVLGTENTLLGFREEIEYNMNSAQFENNDQLYLYTDGVYESLNPEMLKDGLNILKKEILNVIQSDPGNSPESIVKSMDSLRPIDDHKDDVTLIQVRL